MKLFFMPGACSRAPHIALHEIAIPFQSEKVDPKTKVVSEGDYVQKINPKGSVPALQIDDEQVLTETAVLLQFIADLKPEKNLAPAQGTSARYRLQEWLNFISSDIHKTMSPMFNPVVTGEVREFLTTLLHRRLNVVEQALAKRQYLMESGFSVADIYLFVVMGWTGRLNVDISKYKNIAGLIERVGQRPSVKATIAAEA